MPWARFSCTCRHRMSPRRCHLRHTCYDLRCFRTKASFITLLVSYWTLVLDRFSGGVAPASTLRTLSSNLATCQRQEGSWVGIDIVGHTSCASVDIVLTLCAATAAFTFCFFPFGASSSEGTMSPSYAHVAHEHVNICMYGYTVVPLQRCAFGPATARTRHSVKAVWPVPYCWSRACTLAAVLACLRCFTSSAVIH